MNEDEIACLVKSVEQLKCVPVEHRTDTYNKLICLNQIQLYENCEHEYIHDFIDVSLDKTVMITYCNKCNLDFNVNFYFEYFKSSLSCVNKEYWKIKVRTHICPLISFQLKNNRIQFFVYKNDIQTVTINAFLKDLLNSKVYNDTIIIQNNMLNLDFYDL